MSHKSGEDDHFENHTVTVKFQILEVDIVNPCLLSIGLKSDDIKFETD